ncbi:MAG: hypothetical protein JRI25_23785 [Deltaproteobacteria bacterium]|nr:hypothetical protein [Deltaproteobacteria bacterium]
MSGGLLVLGLAGASVVAQAVPPDFSACEDAGLTGPALGLCQAFYAVDCLNGGNPVACDRIEEQYEALGVGPIPGVVPCPCWSPAEIDEMSPASEVAGPDWFRQCDYDEWSIRFQAVSESTSELVAVWVPGQFCVWIDQVGETLQVEDSSITLEEQNRCIADLRASDLWKTYCPQYP